MRDEFDHALSKMKVKKAPGIDGLPSELLKATSLEMKDALFELICEIYETGTLPTDFKKCIIIPLPKKSSANKCEHYRTLSLVSHASKILTTIILNKIERTIEGLLTEDQFGFRKGRGTREAILALRLVLEKILRKDQDTFIAFVDLEKAFDNVKWDVLFQSSARKF